MYDAQICLNLSEIFCLPVQKIQEKYNEKGGKNPATTVNVYNKMEKI